MDRPALQALLSDIEKGKVDLVVVYKVDRLTRSLTDFARIVDVLDGRGVSFVSVTQQFNTTTSKANALSPGNRLLREWRGRAHRVDVLESGVTRLPARQA